MSESKRKRFEQLLAAGVFVYLDPRCAGVVRHAFGAIAEVFAARDALLASGWTEPPVIRVDVIADWDPVHDAWVMR